MVRPARGGAEKARSVTARRDERDKMLDGPLLPINTNRHRDTTSLVYSSALSLLYPPFPYGRPAISRFINKRLYLYVCPCYKRCLSSSFFFPSFLLCLHSITGPLHLLLLCASITLVPFSCDEVQWIAVLTKPYTCMANTSWGPGQGPDWIDCGALDWWREQDSEREIAGWGLCVTQCKR